MKTISYKDTKFQYFRGTRLPFGRAELGRGLQGGGWESLGRGWDSGGRGGWEGRGGGGGWPEDRTGDWRRFNHHGLPPDIVSTEMFPTLSKACKTSLQGHCYYFK